MLAAVLCHSISYRHSRFDAKKQLAVLFDGRTNGKKEDEQLAAKYANKNDKRTYTHKFFFPLDKLILLELPVVKYIL